MMSDIKRGTFSCIVSLMYIIYTTAAGWTKEDSPIPEGHDHSMVAYNENNNLIYLLGGASTANTYRAITFNVSDKSYVHHDQLFSCRFYSFDAQNYVQRGNVLYYVSSYTDNTNNLFSYTLLDPPLNETQCEIVHSMNDISTAAQEGCLATVDQYLLYTRETGLYIYDITDNSWILTPPDTPNMDISRISHVCQVTNNKYLYILGGTDTSDGSRTDTIEKINVNDISNINNEVWALLYQNLPNATAQASSVIFDDIIYYIGGDLSSNDYSKSATVATINTETDAVSSLENGQLIDGGLSGVSAVLVSNTIYAFGGITFTDFARYYQYLTIATHAPTSSPTMGPTTSAPTMAPTSATNPPTNPPTTTEAADTLSLESSTVIIIIAGSAGVVLIICCVIVVIWCRKKKSFETHGAQMNSDNLEMAEKKNEVTTQNQVVNVEQIDLNEGTLKAGHDPATGLAMKAIMYKQLIHCCNENELNVAVCSADMDGMKGLNDTLGHQVTDNIIASIADIMEVQSKDSKNVSVFRMNAGGDEFAMIVRDTNNDVVVQWADDLRKEIQFSTKATISIGVAMRKDKESKNQWFNRAENALMEAKGNGKNRVVLDEQ